MNIPIKTLPISALVNEMNDEGKLILLTNGPNVPKINIAATIVILALLFECDNAYSVLSFTECSESGSFNIL